MTITGDADITGSLSNTEKTSVVFTTTTDTETTGVLTQANLATNDYFEISIGGASMTYGFPASSTWATLIPNAGDYKQWLFHNATTTDGINLAFGSGVGTFVQFATTSPATAKVLASSTASILCIRAVDTDVNCQGTIFGY